MNYRLTIKGRIFVGYLLSIVITTALLFVIQKEAYIWYWIINSLFAFFIIGMFWDDYTESTRVWAATIMFSLSIPYLFYEAFQVFLHDTLPQLYERKK